MIAKSNAFAAYKPLNGFSDGSMLRRQKSEHGLPLGWASAAESPALARTPACTKPDQSPTRNKGKTPPKTALRTAADCLKRPQSLYGRSSPCQHFHRVRKPRTTREIGAQEGFIRGFGSPESALSPVRSYPRIRA